MAFTLARATQSRVDESFCGLGHPCAESQLQFDGTPFFYQAAWTCGCTVEYVHEDQGAYSFEACGDHTTDARSGAGPT